MYKKSNYVKKIINSLQGKDCNAIVAELVHNNYYWNNPLPFYHFFGMEDGTVFQLASYIKSYDNNTPNARMIRISA